VLGPRLATSPGKAASPLVRKRDGQQHREDT
jgi:hypothetical protein